MPTTPTTTPTTTPEPRLERLLVAHRGMPASFPENSLLGFREALQAGARYLETDVQLSADGVAVLSHDVSLRRVAGVDLAIPSTPFAELRGLPIPCAARFGGRYAAQRLATLDDLVGLLQQWPAARAFVEIKGESYARHGAAAVAQVLERLRPIGARSVVISFEPAVLERARALGAGRLGWVLPQWSDAARRTAERLAPHYLFVSSKRVPAPPAVLWPGPWQWVAYTVNDRDQVLALHRRGFALIETDCIADLLRAGP